MTSAGAVAAVRNVVSPIRLALAVLRESPHVLLAATGAEAFADSQGLARVTDPAAYYRAAIELTGGAGATADTAPLAHGTVGAVALDCSGRLAAATSTGGTINKQPGRVGDTPLVGAATWADTEVAVSCTVRGAFFIRCSAAHDVAARIAYHEVGLEPAAQAVTAAELEQLLRQHREWLDSKGSEGQRASFHRALLQDAYLQGADLRGVDFSQALMQGAEMQNANLYRANFSQANLQGASLQRSSLREATLEGAHLIAANNGLVDRRNGGFFISRRSDGAASSGLNFLIATGMIKMVVGVEDMGQFPTLFVERCHDRRNVRRIDGDSNPAFGVVDQKAIIVAQTTELMYVQCSVAHSSALVFSCS